MLRHFEHVSMIRVFNHVKWIVYIGHLESTFLSHSINIIYRITRKPHNIYVHTQRSAFKKHVKFKVICTPPFNIQFIFLTEHMRDCKVCKYLSLSHSTM